MAYPLAEHVPTRRLTLGALRSALLTMMDAEDAKLAVLRERFLAETTFLESPSVQFHKGKREACNEILVLIAGLLGSDVVE